MAAWAAIVGACRASANCWPGNPGRPPPAKEPPAPHDTASLPAIAPGLGGGCRAGLGLSGLGLDLRGDPLWPGRVSALPDGRAALHRRRRRSEEHTSELQSREKLVCRLL